ncbi:hypothetical protein Patl1_12517 [Pistacia atlantica]|uniref:Uncharacterized protein n=1 Tax=Pistacia atlantica TaxID=434234 RepID=A0ACC1AW08_9ROSI|nr:hypothetical protein Patl1_12517 [Pistacia atlantica]
MLSLASAGLCQRQVRFNVLKVIPAGSSGGAKRHSRQFELEMWLVEKSATLSLLISSPFKESKFKLQSVNCKAWKPATLQTKTSHAQDLKAETKTCLHRDSYLLVKMSCRSLPVGEVELGCEQGNYKELTPRRIKNEDDGLRCRSAVMKSGCQRRSRNDGTRWQRSKPLMVKVAADEFRR